jgi:hypothetical protein
MRLRVKDARWRTVGERWDHERTVQSTPIESEDRLGVSRKLGGWRDPEVGGVACGQQNILLIIMSTDEVAIGDE